MLTSILLGGFVGKGVLCELEYLLVMDGDGTEMPEWSSGGSEDGIVALEFVPCA